MNAPLRIVFAGTPEFAAQSLAALLETEHDILGVYTQPDRPAGRGRKLTPSPVKALALEHQLPVFQPLSLRTPEAQAELAALQPDLMIVVAYGLLLPQAVLDIPRLGCLNVHASLLPRWRGAAPIQRALLAGDHETGITLMQMDVGLDTGAMLYKTHLQIAEDETSGQLHDRLAQLGAQTLVTGLEHLVAGKLTPEAQDDTLACYAHKLSKEEGLIDWTLSAQTLARQVRGLNPWPVCYTQMAEATLRIWEAEPSQLSHTSAAPGTLIALDKQGLHVQTGSGVLCIRHLQLPGAKAQPLAALLNGKHPFQVGMRFESHEV